MTTHRERSEQSVVTHPDGQSTYLTPVTDAVAAESTDWQDMWECAQGQEMRARVAETQLALAVAALMKIAVGNYNWVWELAFETLENIKDVEET